MLNKFKIIINGILCLLLNIFVISSNAKVLSDSTSNHPPNSLLRLFKNCIKSVGLSSDSVIDQKTNKSLYNQVNQQWNLRLSHIYPLAYILPMSTKEVQLIIKCASKLNIPVIPKSGGHSFEGYSFGNSKSLIIDLQKMDQIKVNLNKKIALIESGALIGQIHLKLWEQGRVGLPMGTCFTVGIGGLALGGGIGHIANMYGLTCDSIVEFTVVDANGIAHKVNADQHSDLFWALKGIGSGFIGIVTNFKFDLFDASEIKITFVQIYYDDLTLTSQMLEAWQKWLTWTNKNQPTVTSFMDISGTGIGLLSIHVQDSIRQPYGNKTFLKMIGQVFPTSNNITITFSSYMDFILQTGWVSLESNKNVYELNLANLRSERIKPMYFKKKSFFVNKSFDINEWKDAIDLIHHMPKYGTTIEFSGLGGAVLKIPPTATSFVHRKFLYLLDIEYESLDDINLVESLTWIQKFIQKSQFIDDGESYQNDVDNDLEPEEYLNRFYGDNLKKLIFRKRKWDSRNYFQNPMSIPIFEWI